MIRFLYGIVNGKNIANEQNARILSVCCILLIACFARPAYAEETSAIYRMPAGIYRETEDYLEVKGVQYRTPPIAQGFHAEITNITEEGFELVNYDGEGKDVGHILYTKLDDTTYQCVSDVLTWTLILHPESRSYETRYCFLGYEDVIVADIFTCA